MPTFNSAACTVRCSARVTVHELKNCHNHYTTMSSLSLPRLTFPKLPSITIKVTIPSLSQWTGILLAAPKKKTSHQKKRQRQLAPGKKQIKVLNNLNRCPSCGHYKRAHTLCMVCVGQIQHHWKNLDRKQADLEVLQPLDETDERVLYPRKTTGAPVPDKDEYLKRRLKPLPVRK